MEAAARLHREVGERPLPSWRLVAISAETGRQTWMGRHSPNRSEMVSGSALKRGLWLFNVRWNGEAHKGQAMTLPTAMEAAEGAGRAAGLIGPSDDVAGD